MCDLLTAKYYQYKASLRADYLAILDCGNGEYILASEQDFIMHPELNELKEVTGVSLHPLV